MDPDRDDAARLRRGDTAGLSGLMGRHGTRLLRYLARFLGDPGVAEDVFQQTWLQVAERIGRYDAGRPFGPWLFAVARHLALDHLRRRQPESLEEADDLGARPAPEGDALQRVAALERRERLGACLAELGPLDREVLSLRFEEELRLPELAATLDVPVPTAKARLYRALARLRERLLAAGPVEDWR